MALMADKKTILNFSNALLSLKELICKRENLMVSGEIYLNQRRYCLLSFKNRFGSIKRYLCLFKKDFYMKFGDDFKDQGEQGIGESINADALDYALNHNIDAILYAYDDGRVYTISPEKIAFRGHKRRTYAENKEVYSFSIQHLERFL